MPELPKYHLREQQADALLAPLRLSLWEMEERSGHYLERLSLTKEDAEAVRAAHTALATARAEVERLWHDRVSAGAGRGEQG